MISFYYTIMFFLLTNSNQAEQTSTIEHLNIWPFNDIRNCRKNEYYDSDLFKCTECSSKNGPLRPSDDRLTCICPPDTFAEVIYDSIKRQPICKPIECKSCLDPSGIVCPLKYIDVIRNGSDEKSIQIFRDDSHNCSCNAAVNILYNDFCITSTLLRSYQHFSAFQLKGQSLSELPIKAFFCKTFADATACNYLANLCVSSFYSLAKNSPCNMFYLRQATDAVDFSDEDVIRPFLFYKKGKVTKRKIDRTIDATYSLKSEKNSAIQLVSTVHSSDGKLIRIGDFPTNFINLCSRNRVSDYDSFKFAQNYKTSCDLTLNHLIEISSEDATKYFYSIFLNYTIDKVHYLQQVPIRIRNAFKFNEADDSSEWQLVKRFQIFDFEKLQTASVPLGFDDSLKTALYKSIRLIDYFHLSVQIKDGNRITTPLITLRYKTIEIYKNSSLNSRHSYTFSVQYAKRQHLNFYFELMLPLTLAIGFAFSILRIWNFKTQQNKEYYDFPALCQFTLYLFSSCANAFFFVSVFICFYVFFTYVGQNTVKLLLPIPQQELIDVLVGVAFGLKSVYLIFYFAKVTHMDIFFIDWERPKCYDAITLRGSLDTPSVCSSVRSPNFESVSAWRNVFVANEWLKISTKRKTSTLLQNILLLTCIELIKSNMHFLRHPANSTLILSLIILLQIVLYALQLLINYFITERLYGNPLQQFIDICSTSNISVFALLQNFYGFYIHGRSPHGFSDTDMSSMIMQLQREAKSMGGKRGLLTGSDNQTYVILVPTNLIIYYAKLLAPFQKAASLSQSHFERKFTEHNKSPDYLLERSMAAYNNVNRFFCAFIDHGVKDLDYIVKEKTFFEVIFDCEFDIYLSETKGTFYVDSWQSFKSVLMYGNDMQLFLYELMLFCCTFILFENVTLSAFVTSIFDKVFHVIFRTAIRSNVANKTLIDRRFLN